MRLTLLLACISAIAVPLVATGQELSCSSAVTLNGGTIEVAADASGDDTENLQCALSSAAEGGFRDVLLISSSYSIGAVSTRGFVGDLRGVSKGATLLAVQNGSLTCADNNSITAAMEFQVGNASIRNMSISVDSPCSDGNPASVIAFYSDQADCDARTVFGNVDRVVISGSGIQGSDTVFGITASAAPGCDVSTQKVLGTLKVNRSEIDNLDYGVQTSIGGGGQVDINYNTFEKVGLPISVLNANQSTTVLANKISFNDVGYSAASGLGTVGIYVASDASSPAKNSTTISKNTLTDGGYTESGIAILVGQLGKLIDHKMTVSSNTFRGSGNNTTGRGIAALDTNDGIVTGNRFVSRSGAWIDISSGNISEGFVGSNVSGWAVVANDFDTSTADTDIILGEGTSGAIVGRTQGYPEVEDQTGNNDVLESAASPSAAYSKRGRMRLPSTELETVFKQHRSNLLRFTSMTDSQ